ncbi:MAG: bestrophin family ion channel [Pseudomonadota bacterium]
MYVRRGINPWHLFHDSWRFLVFAALWALIVVYLREFQGIEAIGLPIAPVTTIGIAVSLYLGFKSRSAYGRWWEARRVWGDIVNNSRNWGNHVFNLVYSENGKIDPAIHKELIERHVAWVNALAYQLRKATRLKETSNTRIFGHRRVFDEHDFHQTADSYRRHMSDEGVADVDRFANPAVHILRRQGDALRQLAEQGVLDSYRHAQLMTVLGSFYNSQGSCERIKNTPFPRQIANFGMAFTWAFIIMLPLAFVEIFETAIADNNLSTLVRHEFMLTLVPFSVVISWIFYLMEKVSDSVEDPFEGGVTDVPISTLCRVIEIDLKQMLGAEEVPPPVKPVDGVMY